MKIRAVGYFTLFCSSVLFGQLAGVGGFGPGGPGGRGPGGPRAMHAGKVVTGAPYTATVTSTSVKTLADGNTIQRTTTGIVARDSQGRTYSQETISGLFGQAGTKIVTFISDPVAGYVYTLNSETKTATRRALHTPSESASISGPASGFRESKGAGAGVASSEATGRVSSDLGIQVVNGVNAQGKSITHTIPAGQIGNEKPIVATTETWYSPDLKVVVSSKRTDAREGTSTYALTNIQRAEPAGTLFAVPSDFTVKDAASFGPRH